MYFKLIQKINLINSEVRNITNLCIVDFILAKFSILLTPFFLILRFTPNQITILNFFVGILSIYLINFKDEFFQYGILCFFLFIILDHIDGSVARYRKIKSFFGKFMDALFDAIIFGFFFISITLYSFNLTGSQNILIFGIFSSSLLLIDILTLDKFAALVRWSNEQNKKNLSPYIRKTKFFRFFASLRDIIFICVISLIFLTENLDYFKISLIIIFSSMTISSLMNVIMHMYFAGKHLKFKKK